MIEYIYNEKNNMIKEKTLVREIINENSSELEILLGPEPDAMKMAIREIKNGDNLFNRLEKKVKIKNMNKENTKKEDINTLESLWKYDGRTEIKIYSSEKEQKN